MNPFQPTKTLIVKLGALLIYLDGQFDAVVGPARREAARRLLADPEVLEWRANLVAVGGATEKTKALLARADSMQ